MPSDAQQFLNDLDKKLWSAADRLRASLDAAVYKHAVLGLIFLKYVSDSFRMRQEEVTSLLRDPESDYYLDPEDYGGSESEAYAEALRVELEERDYYLEKNVFWVPALARWKTLQDNAKLPPGTKIEIPGNGGVPAGTPYEIKSLGRFIDDALEAVERENPKLKGFIEKNRYARLEIPQENLGGLIDLIATIAFEDAPSPQPSPKGRGGKIGASDDLPLPLGEGRGEGNTLGLNARDILGHVYEYFLGQFALAEGKKGGQYFTPKSIVSLIVEMLEPYQGRVYDPAMGSGGFFVQSERFIKEHGGKLGNLSVYGQESNPTTWRLAAMNMAIRGIDFNFGKEPANSFTHDQHPDLRDFTAEDTKKIAGTFRKWRRSSLTPSGRSGDEGYMDEAGFCKSATLEEIKRHDYVLTPGRYVGAADLEDDGIPFETKMTELSQTLYAQMAEGQKLDAVIRKNLEGLGYGE